ncbi:MAG: A/G-specific adenine glycosylase, partial [Alphaproteobacteria bacterium HGW-Alphaproteobacteria-5]
ADWRRVPGAVRHTFTHFHLVLSVMTARLPSRARPSRGTWVPRDTFRPADLPTLMRKVHDLASACPGDD